MQFLDQAAVAARLDMTALIDRMEEALIAFSAGDVVQPVRQFVAVEEHGGFFGLMPAVSDAMGVKLVTFYPRNQEKDLHTHHALILLFDPETGVPTAVMDGGLITEKRTAATSAAATRFSEAECRRGPTSKHCGSFGPSRRSGSGAATRSMPRSWPRTSGRRR
jgi:ornithine cyclodeaminase/alanine dehydrogenase-like protein (mu-crystallin family)